VSKAESNAGPGWRGKVLRVSDWCTHRRSMLQEPLQFNDVRTLECIVQLDPGQPTPRVGQRLRVTLGAAAASVLVAQNYLFAYMKKEFSFDHLEQARLGDPMHFHSYSLEENKDGALRLQLEERLSTDSEGIGKCIGLQVEANVELEEIVKQLERKISAQTLMSMEQPPPAASLIDEASHDES